MIYDMQRFSMRDQGTTRGKSRKTETEDKSAGTEGKASGAKPAPLTAKEKIALNQKNKRRK